MTGAVVNPHLNKTSEGNPLAVQDGGGHYKKYKVQPIEYAMVNNLNYWTLNDRIYS